MLVPATEGGGRRGNQIRWNEFVYTNYNYAFSLFFPSLFFDKIGDRV